MEQVHKLFLEAMAAALADRTVNWGEEVSQETLTNVFILSQEHHVLPLIFEAVYPCKAAAALPAAAFGEMRRATVHSVMTQAVKTEEFLELYRHLRKNGVKPLLVKGLICRNLYPRPDYRFSGDEDVLCGESRFKACHKEMIRFGMEPCSSSLDSYEIPYRKEDGALYIELHKTLFPSSSDVFGDCNRLFEKAFDHAVEVEIQGVPVATLDWSEHMLYLILHAFKHFLHSGFGIRQVCDMVLFANVYGSKVDWKWVLSRCKGLRAEKFAAGIFAIGQQYLGFDPEKAAYPRFWREIQVDPEPLLEDLLCGGIYGASDRSRVHSCNMTLNAVAADKKGKRVRGNLLKTVFPSAKNLESRFHWLHRKPWLLPVAWICRIFGYAKETISHPAGSAAEVIRTGSKRVELLRTYDIID